MQARRVSRSRLYFSKFLGSGQHASSTEMSCRGLSRMRGCFYASGPLSPPPSLPGSPQTPILHTRRSRFHFSESLGPGLHVGSTEMSGRGLSRMRGCFFASGPLSPCPCVLGVPKTQWQHARRSRSHFFKSLRPRLHAGNMEMAGRCLSRVHGAFLLVIPAPRAPGRLQESQRINSDISGAFISTCPYL